MSAPLPPRSRGRVLVAGLLIAAGALVAIFFLAHRAPRAPRAVEEAEVAARAPAPAMSPALGAAPEGAQETAPGNPIIDEIRVEKQEVCEGEENLITIKAHTPAGRDDAFLHYAIGGTAGRSIPIRAVLPAAGLEDEGPRRVQVFGRGDAMTAADVPHYTVKKCRPDRVLFLKARQMPNSSDEFELVATVHENGPSPPLRVTSYRWSFGDGANTVTEASSVVHRFEPSNPDALYSELLVTCEAVGGDGRTVVGRTALSLRNLEFENLEFQKTLVLSVEFIPRFPELDASGQVVQRVRLYHHRSAPVRLQRASVSYRGRPGRESSPEETHAVAELLGTEEVPPGHGIEHVFRLDTRAHPDAIMADYFVDGLTADGVKASASFSIMVPPALPTPETGARVVDALLTQKILRARERLGKPFVNDEDLRQLERAGAFADLKAPPADPAAAAGEDVVPSPAVIEAARAAKRSAVR